MAQHSSNQKKKYPQITENGTILHRDYCFMIDGQKYNRNVGCKCHDNAYGINGGGSEKDRRKADVAFYNHLKANKDPMALWAYYAVRLLGWAFFNYKRQNLWSGQLLKKIGSLFKQR